MQEHLYTTTEVGEITGFSQRQLDYWAREKMIIPSFQQAHGSGSRRLYTVEDLVQLNIVRQLKKGSPLILCERNCLAPKNVIVLREEEPLSSLWISSHILEEGVTTDARTPADNKQQ